MASGPWRRCRPIMRDTMVGSMTVSPSCDPAEGVDEDGAVEDSFLEDVADSFGLVLDEPHGVARLDVLGEHEDADVVGARRGSAWRRRALRRCGLVACGCRRWRCRAARLTISRIRLSASPAWATTSMPASRSTWAIPSRTSITSSAITTRMGSPLAGLRARSTAFRRRRRPCRRCERCRAGGRADRVSPRRRRHRAGERW